MYFPAGTHEIKKTIYLPSNTTVYGEGEQTVLRGSVNPLFKCEGKTGIRFRDLRIENLDAHNYATSIHLANDPDTGEHCEDVVIERVTFVGSATKPGDTHHAVLCNHADNLKIRDCNVRFMQLKLASGRDPRHIHDISVTGCVFESPFNFACSFVGTSPMDTLQNFTFSSNVVHSLASSGGLFVGGDGEGSSAHRLSNVHIQNNVFDGGWGDVAFAAIHVLLASENERISICGNHVSNGDQVRPNTIGISVKNHNGGSRVRGLWIKDNAVNGTDLHGVRVHVAKGVVDGAWVCDNDCRGTRGVLVYGELLTNVTKLGNLG